LWQRQTRGKGIFYQESYMLRHAEFKVMLWGLATFIFLL
jgi:hypothetical protein